MQTKYVSESTPLCAICDRPVEAYEQCDNPECGAYCCENCVEHHCNVCSADTVCPMCSAVCEACDRIVCFDCLREYQPGYWCCNTQDCCEQVARNRHLLAA